MLRTLLAATLLATVLAPAARAQTLDDLRWRNRILVLASADAASPEMREQERLLLADRSALAERELVVLAIEGQTLRAVFGKVPADETADTLRRRFGFDPAISFRAVLVGKDGGVKWSAEAPAPLTEINAVIDAMPMRRADRG